MSCEELTKEELKNTNGCGSSYWLVSWIRLPRWLSESFFHCCNRHDLRYQRQEDKAFADDELYDCWMYNAFHSPWWQRGWKIKLAEIGYWCLNSRMSDVCYVKGGRDED